MLRNSCACVALLMAGGAQAADGVDQGVPTIGFYGVPGLLDMPVAMTMPDGEISFSTAYIDTSLRSVLNFQITPRLSGVLRYVVSDNYGGSEVTYYDRSFDLNYLFFRETPVMPALMVGLRDFGGTGIYSSEYIVGTKTLGRFRVTGGIGWGRLASRGGFSNPFGILGDKLDTRPARVHGETGEFEANSWFRGDAALFGGLQYQASKRLVLTAEYSSDAYEAEEEKTDFDQKSPINLGATYRFDSGVDVTGAWMYGNYAMLGVSYSFNLKSPPQLAKPRLIPEPQVVPRSAVSLGWGHLPDAPGSVTASEQATSEQLTAGQVATEQPGPADAMPAITAALKAQGIENIGVRHAGSAVTIWIRNDAWLSEAEAVGRAARALTGVLPGGIETITLVTTRNGMPLAAQTVHRDDLVELQNDPEESWHIYARSQIEDAAAYPMPTETWPQFSYGIGAYVGPTFSDPDNFFAENGLRLDASYSPLPGVIFSAQLRQPVLRATNGPVPLGSESKVADKVRSDAGLYEDDADPEIRELKAEYFVRPGRSLYGRLSMGYLEEMYGGVSGEMLWKPQGPLALGLELNYAHKREPGSLLGFGDYSTETGYASAYYDFGGGYVGRIDAGRYLAQDWGATVSLSREFANGFRIGAYFTKTDVSSDEFGEGAFDKGITFSIPIAWLFGKPTRNIYETTWRPINGDGGARMQISDRLYELVRRSDFPALDSGWEDF